VNLDIECVIFFKTGSPIDPVDFVHRICRETVSQTGIMRMRYVNRLTPVSMTAKASEKGLEEVGRSVIGKYFQLSDEGLLQEQEKGNSSSLPGLYSVSYFIFPQGWLAMRNVRSTNRKPYDSLDICYS
jgi:tRNA acetyltransferase TAN1